MSAFTNTAADKIGGGFGRQALRTIDYLVPGVNTLGTGRLKSFAEDWDKRAQASAARERDQAAARAGLRFGSTVKGDGDVGLLFAPAAGAEKLVKATKFATNLEKSGKAGKVASGALQRGAGSLAATGVQTSIDVGQGRNPELAKNLGIGVGIDVVGSPIIGKAWRAIAAGPTVRALAKSSDIVDVASRLSKRYPNADPDELAKIADQITAQNKAKDVRKTLKNFEKTGTVVPNVASQEGAPAVSAKLDEESIEQGSIKRGVINEDINKLQLGSDTAGKVSRRLSRNIMTTLSRGAQ